MLLASLCEQSFFDLWTYPNLFKKPARELVDLMVVFRNDVLLFSDKSCAYPETGDPKLDWQRWYSRAIAKSAHQVHQAERWLRSYPGCVFLDAKATQKLPLDLPAADVLNIHRICVTTGAADHCRRVTGQPMLGLNFTITGNVAPLSVGTVPEAKGFLHVFDADALALVMRELDTISDFVAYLNAKADIVGLGLLKGAPTEADVLAYYLHNGRTFPNEGREFVLQPNLWRQVEAQAPFRDGRLLNQRHRLWDRLIERVTRLYLTGELQIGNETTMSDHERLVRVMASENRFYRRILSQAIEDRARRAQGGWIGSILPSEDPNVLLYRGRSQGRSYLIGDFLSLPCSACVMLPYEALASLRGRHCAASGWGKKGSMAQSLSRPCHQGRICGRYELRPPIVPVRTSSCRGRTVFSRDYPMFAVAGAAAAALL